MRASKRGRGVRVRALQLSLFALSLVPAFTGNGAAADPPPERKTAPSSDADRKKLLAERERFSVESWKHESQGKLTEAIAAAEKMLAIERKVLGDFNDDVVDSLVRLAEMHEAREEFAVARQARQDVLAIRTKLYGEKEWRVTDARLALEQTIRLSQFDAAERREHRAQRVAVHHGRQRLARGGFDAHRRVVDEDARGVHVQRRAGRAGRGRRLRPQRRALGAEDVHRDVGEVHQHFLLVGELRAVGLHRHAEDHQRRFLEGVDRAPLVGEHAVIRRSPGFYCFGRFPVASGGGLRRAISSA